MCSAGETRDWSLEAWVEGESVLRRFPLEALPARIGRRPRSEIHLDLPHISIDHAEIYRREGGLWLRDLASRNGTFLNGERVVGERRLAQGDIIHFACSEFELGCAEPKNLGFDQTVALVRTLAKPFAGRMSDAKALRELMCERLVEILFQPIVDLRSKRIAHFEILGTGNHPGLPNAPSVLFSIAEDAGVSVDLSELLCEQGLQEATRLPTGVGLFVNSHPKQLGDARLLTILRSVRERYPQRAITLEIHETSVTDPLMMRELRAQLSALGIGLA